jgi:hypothetical protein
MWTSRLDRKAPGASSEQEYRRQMNDHWWENRWSGLYFLFLAIVPPMVALLFSIGPVTVFILGVAAGVGILGLCIFAGVAPPSIGRWRDGAEGERSTAAQLEKLTGLGYTTIHDRALKWGNVDHVLVGPAGVFVVDSKNWNGKVEVIGDVPHKNGFAQNGLARSAKSLGRAINAEIKRSTTTNAWVDPVIVFWCDFPQNHVEADGVTYVAGETLTPWLHSRESKLKREQIAEIAKAIEAMPDGVELGPYSASSR